MSVHELRREIQHTPRNYLEGVFARCRPDNFGTPVGVKPGLSNCALTRHSPTWSGVVGDLRARPVHRLLAVTGNTNQERPITSVSLQTRQVQKPYL